MSRGVGRRHDNHERMSQHGISALDARLDWLEDRFRTIRNVQDDVRTTVNKQQHQIFDMDSRISFYSGSIVQLEGKKAEEVKARFDALELSGPLTP